MMYKRIFALILSALLLNSCSMLLVGTKQKSVIIKTDIPEGRIYVNGELTAKGQTAQLKKTTKNGFKQVKVSTPLRDRYYVLTPEKRATGWYITMPLDIVFLVPTMSYSFLSAMQPLPKYYKYAEINNFEDTFENPQKKETEKDIRYVATKIKVDNYKTDFEFYKVKYKPDLITEYQKAEDKAYQDAIKAEKKKKKKKKDSGDILLDEDDNKIDYDDSYFSGDIFHLLVESGYVDTTGNVLKAQNDVVGLEATIVGGKMYSSVLNYSPRAVFQMKLDIDWRFKNAYNQTIDSVRVSEFSDQFVFNQYYRSEEERDDDMRTAFRNAVNNSFLALYQTKGFNSNIKKGAKPVVSNTPVSIKTPNADAYVKNVKDAMKSAVTIKIEGEREHGSGFAISTDGYIITNYHVVAGDYPNTFKKFKVVMPGGNEEEGEVVSSDPNHDFALIKVNAPFEKCFQINKSKNYEAFDEVSTVGTPISVQLGSSVASGVISNERDIDGDKLIQLNMSISPGNSGGPLFDTRTGQLKGVITSKLIGRSIEGISFAQPAFYLIDNLNIKFQ